MVNIRDITIKKMEKKNNIEPEIKLRFKRWDEVFIETDLTEKRQVMNSWMEKGGFFGNREIEKVALDDNKVYRASELIEYSRTIEILGRQINALKNKDGEYHYHDGFSFGEMLTIALLSAAIAGIVAGIIFISMK